MKGNPVKTVVQLLSLMLFSWPVLAEIINNRQYSEDFASAGQPTAAQLAQLAEAGTKRIVYLAYTDNDTAIAIEDRVVMDLGMEYVHIPVDFMNPTLGDFEHFAAVMNTAPTRKTLVHCQINLRASAFSFLYRVIHRAVPMAEALEDMQSVWSPNEIWFGFIQEVLLHHGLDTDCDGCDWGGMDLQQETE